MGRWCLRGDVVCRDVLRLYTSDGVCNKGIAEVDRKCKAASPAVTGKIMNRVCDDCLADAWAGLFYSGKCSTILNNDSDYMNENVLEKVYCK